MKIKLFKMKIVIKESESKTVTCKKPHVQSVKATKLYQHASF